MKEEIPENEFIKLIHETWTDSFRDVSNKTSGYNDNDCVSSETMIKSNK